MKRRRNKLFPWQAVLLCDDAWPLADTVSGKLQNNNIYTIAKRNVEGQDMLYQSLKLTNGIWILAELRIQPGNPNYTVSYPQPFNPDVDMLQCHYGPISTQKNF